MTFIHNMKKKSNLLFHKHNHKRDHEHPNSTSPDKYTAEASTLSSSTAGAAVASDPHGSTLPSNSQAKSSSLKNCTQMIGSRSSLVLSPNGKSIGLSPLPPKILSGTKALLKDSTTISPIFRQDVREEWINAVFGLDFFPRRVSSDEADSGGYSHACEDAMMYTPPREGMGLAKIPSYLSYTATIVNPLKESNSGKNDKSDENDKGQDAKAASVLGKKIGVTLSRIPIGVYARIVDLESEAYAAGVVPGSILVDINGMGVLGEPSHKLLERLWIYEGHFRHLQQKEEMKNGRGGGGVVASDVDVSLLDDKENENSHGKNMGRAQNGRTMHVPVALTWIKDGQLYSTILMTGAPFGISWAPCGNFALVQRAYSFAQKAGVRRGCIIAAVNHKSMRDMDHLDTAIELKEQFNKGRDIRIVCVYTPAASRTNFFKSKGVSGNALKSNPNDFKSIDGVKVRKVNPLKRQPPVEKPTEYGVGSFFSCGTGVNYTPVTSGAENDLISDLANSVAAGEIAAPTGTRKGLISVGKSHKNSNASFEQLLSKRLSTSERSLSSSLKELEKKYDDLPTMNWSGVISQWNFLDAIVFCTRMHAAGYNEESFVSMGGMIGGSGDQSALLLTKNVAKPTTIIPLHSTAAYLGLLKSFKSSPNAPEIMQYYLPQILAFISSEQSHTSVDHGAGDGLDDKTASEIVKVAARKASEEIIDVIVDIALHDDDLCQTLHFLLRSFSSSFAKLNPSPGFDMLTFAHQYLKNRLLEVENSDSMAPSLNSPASVSCDGFFEYGSLQSPSWTSQNSKNDNSPSEVVSKKPLRKKIGRKVAKMFKNRLSSTEEDSELSISVVPSDAVEVESLSSLQKQATGKKKIGFMPTSILRKAVDQIPLDNHFGLNAFTEMPSTPELFENMGWFLSHLDKLCGNIERSLLKSVSQKVTDWALQPWNDSKHRALAESTAEMRNRLRDLNDKEAFRDGSLRRHWSPMMNPMDSSEILVSAVPEESFILPSAHFPLLLAFDTRPNPFLHMGTKKRYHTRGKLHRTQVKFISAQGNANVNENMCYLIYAAVGGTLKATGRSSIEPYYGSTTHRWRSGNELEFESRLPNHPRTLEIKICAVANDSVEVNEYNALEEKAVNSSTEIGFAFLDITSCWKSDEPQTSRHVVDVFACNSKANFDQSGNLIGSESQLSKVLSVDLEVATESFPLLYATDMYVDSPLNQRRMLLYKHDEDMRQEMLAIQFLDICDRLLKASGLDLKIKKYKCLSVGENKGFIEWIPGAIALSEICKPVGKVSSGPNDDQRRTPNDSYKSHDAVLDDESTTFVRTGAWCKHESLRDLRKDPTGLAGNNPIQDFLRSNAFDSEGPYLINKDVMDNYVKSCAGYCVITYLLGVGDRHTDNLLLHPEGHFLHCDFSFILGRDPKTFLPMRITEHMVNGMGGRESDNFAKFLSLAGAAFVTLRQPASVRVLMSLIKGMLYTNISDISVTQKPEEALRFVHDRFCLDLTDDDAVAFLEENIERSLSSKIWIAVDAMHSIGKRF